MVIAMSQVHASLPTPTLLEADIPRGEGYRVKLSLRAPNEWVSEPHIDCRIWTAWKSAGEGGPGGTATRKGFTVPLRSAGAFISAMQRLLAEGEARGLLLEEGQEIGP